MLEQEEITDRIIGAAREVEAVHLAFGRSYLRAVGRRNGILLNFKRSHARDQTRDRAALRS